MIAIITDSTCDIPEDIIGKYGIIVVPQYIIWDDQQFRDRVEIQPVEFYERLTTDAKRPTTAQASAGDFLTAINQALELGATEAVILTVSSAMSGTFNNAKQASADASIRVEVIDSKGPTMSLGWQVLTAARARDDGASLDDIVNKVAKVRPVWCRWLQWRHWNICNMVVA